MTGLLRVSVMCMCKIFLSCYQRVFYILLKYLNNPKTICLSKYGPAFQNLVSVDSLMSKVFLKSVFTFLARILVGSVILAIVLLLYHLLGKYAIQVTSFY